MSRLLAVILAAVFLAPVATSQATPLVYFAGQAGRVTIERDRNGGNPFASALIETLEIAGLDLRAFGSHLATANAKYSLGWQAAELPRKLPDLDWTFDRRAGERRAALIIAVSDYSAAGGNVLSLAGSRLDAKRLAASFEAAGFSVTTLLDTPRADLGAALDAFAETSATADVAMIYVTGHGIQRGRMPYLMLGDYPGQSPDWLADHAVSLDRLSSLARARTLNLVFFSSCRDNPFFDLR
jgi:hypothetical protein